MTWLTHNSSFFYLLWFPSLWLIIAMAERHRD
jgi:hypothetical protein